MSVSPSYRSSSLLCAERMNLCVALWFNTPSVDDVRAVVEQAERGLHEFGGETMLINAIVGRRRGDGAVRPDFSSEVRKELVAFSKRDELHRLGAAHLVLADGFVGAAVRTFLNTIRLVARPKTPLQVFSRTQPTADWLAELAGPEAWDSRGIRMFFDEVRELR